jgi:hypothetical protein
VDVYILKESINTAPYKQGAPVIVEPEPLKKISKIKPDFRTPTTPDSGVIVEPPTPENTPNHNTSSCPVSNTELTPNGEDWGELDA